MEKERKVRTRRNKREGELDRERIGQRNGRKRQDRKIARDKEEELDKEEKRETYTSRCAANTKTHRLLSSLEFAAFVSHIGTYTPMEEDNQMGRKTKRHMKWRTHARAHTRAARPQNVHATLIDTPSTFQRFLHIYLPVHSRSGILSSSSLFLRSPLSDMSTLQTCL